MTTTEWRRKNPKANKTARGKEKLARMSNLERGRKYKKYQREWRKRRLKEISMLARQKPCSECGQEFPFFMMEFDHVDGTTRNNRKYKSIGEMVAGSRVSNKQLECEIAKCEVVCANCHRARTYFRSPEEWE